MHLVRLHPEYSQGRELTIVDELSSVDLPHGAMLNGIKLTGEAVLLLHQLFIEDFFALWRLCSDEKPDIVLQAWLLPWFCVTAPRDVVTKLEALIPHWARLEV